MVQIPLTAKQLGLMEGRPIPTDKLVTHENQLLVPFNRWSFSNESKLNRTSVVWRGTETVTPLSETHRDLSLVTYRNRIGDSFSFDDMVEASYTDGIVVLHHGKIIYEKYLNGMSASTLHAWASGSKSLVGTLAEHHAEEGLFEPERKICDYLPFLCGSGFDGATVRHAMDMTTAVGFPDDDPDPISESYTYAVCMGWRAPKDPSEKIESIYDYLVRFRKTGNHGERFVYQTPNTDVLAWLLTELTGKTLSELTQEVIWKKIGADRDAAWIVNREGIETAGSGLLTTTRDMAKFGKLIMDGGVSSGSRVLAEGIRSSFVAGGSKEAFARGPAASPMNAGQSYRSQWWVTHDGWDSFQALGYGGQMLYLAPKIDLVIAKHSSFPTPTPAGNEFYSAMGAFPALAKFLAETT